MDMITNQGVGRFTHQIETRKTTMITLATTSNKIDTLSKNKVRDENETLREEMTGLNKAYMGLENKYRLLQAELTAAPAAAAITI
jgi:hypothetical protein